MASIPFTQFSLPKGERRAISIMVAPAAAAKAQTIIAAGFTFECEVLRSGNVSLTITHPEKGDLAIRVRRNDRRSIVAAVEEMVRDFDPAKVKAL